MQLVNEGVISMLKLAYLDNVSPDDLLAAGLNLWYKPVIRLFLGKLGGKVESRHISLIQVQHSVNVLLLHRPNTLNRRAIGQGIFADLILRLAIWGQRAETALIQLLPLQSSVVIPTGAERLRQDDTSGVQTLPDLVQVAAAGDLLDQNGSETLASELLVDGEEVDFGAEDYLVADAEVNGDGGDEGDELAGLRGSDTDMVLFLPAWRHHGPASMLAAVTRLVNLNLPSENGG